jgi:hypothetical protein
MTTREANAVAWRTSSYSGNGEACVEVGWLGRGNGAPPTVGTGVLVRDSKNPGGPILHITGQYWRDFLTTFVPTRH